MDYKSEFQSDDDFDCSNSYSDNFPQQSTNNAGPTQFNTSQGRLANTSGLSKAELRKTNKPIMEKRRRARINHCLNELKSLILEAMKKDPARHTKLEKADILEMTVKHLQSIQRQQLNMALQTDPTVIHKFKTGFMECADEVNRYVSQLDGVEDSVRQRLTSHLNSCATGLEQIGSMTNFSNGYRTGATSNLFANGNNMPLTVTNNNGSLFQALPQDLNNNPATGIQVGGVQLIPSRLPSGEFALIVPNTANNTVNAAALLNNNSNTAFPTWPTKLVNAPANTVTPINDFAANFKRLSAFSKPQNTIINPLKVPAVNSYPQTTLITQANYQQHTQPQQQQQQQQQAFHTTTTTSPPLSPISSVSSNNEDSVTNTCTDFTHSRQDKHSSFSGVFATPPSSAENSFTLNASHLQQQQVSSTSSSDLNTSTNSSLKRSFSEAADSSICSEDEPSSKKYHKEQPEAEDQDSMWRPW